MKNNINDVCESFLEEWNRHDWMLEHGEWESEEWDEKRSDYEEAVKELQKAVEALPDSNAVDRYTSFEDIKTALETLENAASLLDSQVCPDESDYIAEGVIDPDNVSDSAKEIGIGCRWQGWDCTEGWGAYRADNALYIRWWRNASGNRHDRDLWVIVDPDFFEDEESEKEITND